MSKDRQTMMAFGLIGTALSREPYPILFSTVYSTSNILFETVGPLALSMAQNLAKQLANYEKRPTASDALYNNFGLTNPEFFRNI